MKKSIRQVVVIALFAVTMANSNTAFLYASGAKDTGDYQAVTQADLDEFQLTYYTEKTIFPLDNLVTLDGKPFDPAAVRGKYTLLNLWATWCPYCAKEKPSIQALYNTYEAEDFTVLTIALGEEIKAVQEYMHSNKYTFPVVVDKEGVLKASYAPHIPTTYIIDPNGYIVAEIEENKNWVDKKALKILSHIIPVFKGER